MFRTAARLCRQYLKWYGNASYNPEKNGERWLLERLRVESFGTILDVGANVGRWATLAATTFPAATVYALEIVPPTFARLRTETAGFPGIRPVNLGLAERTARLAIRYDLSASAHATFTEYPHGWTGKRIDCDVTTGDQFLDAHGLRAVDFVKIDVEGAEHLVLEGLRQSLGTRRIRFLQFEYGKVNILTRFLLKDFYDLFAGYDYVVGKIYPDHVDFRDFDLGDEDFLGPNYLACRREEPLAEALRRG